MLGCHLRACNSRDRRQFRDWLCELLEVRGRGVGAVRECLVRLSIAVSYAHLSNVSYAEILIGFGALATVPSLRALASELIAFFDATIAETEE